MTLEQLRAYREKLVREHMADEIDHAWDKVLATFPHPHYEIIATGAVHDGKADVQRYYTTSRETFPDQKWRRQVPIGPYFADILNVRARLVIELDGGQHAEAIEYDARRTRSITSEGYRVICFWNNDITQNMSGVLRTVSLSLGAREGAAPAAEG